jgi:hypothetical protein
MPGMKGFELLAETGKRFPAIKRALITAYDVRDYLNLAKIHDIGNIITKSTPFNFNEVRTLVSNIITGDIFGLDKYIDAPVDKKMISRAAQIEKVILEISSSMKEPEHKRKFRQALGEIVINAFFYGARDEKGDKKDTWEFNAESPPGMEIEVLWGEDQEKAGVSVTDRKGKLTKKDILYWIERNTVRNGNGLSPGLMDSHGKGLFIAREIIDRLIINIKRGERTEVVMLNYRKGLYDGHRPLWIQEL